MVILIQHANRQRDYENLLIVKLNLIKAVGG